MSNTLGDWFTRACGDVAGYLYAASFMVRNSTACAPARARNRNQLGFPDTYLQATHCPEDDKKRRG